MPVMSIRLFLAALIAGSVLAGAASAQSGTPPISDTTIRSHMEFLASDALNGRGSGTRDEWIAATYLGAEARRIGLEPLEAGGEFVQSVEIERSDVNGLPLLTAGSLKYSQGTHAVVIRVGMPRSGGPLLRFHAGKTVPAGAVVLMPDNAPRGIPSEATEAAILLFHSTPAQKEHWNDLAHRVLTVGTPRLAGVDRGGTAAAPLVRVSQVLLDDEGYQAFAQLAEHTLVQLSMDARDSIGHTWNTVAKLKGSDAAAPVLLLTAHLDHLGARDSGADRIYNGADDDASGSVAVLVLAEALARGPQPKRTIVFAWFGSEEAGGFGARYFVEKPVLPLAKIGENLEFEMIGRTDPAIAPHTLWLTGWERSNLGPTLAQHGARVVADPHPEENFFMRSDNIALARHGVVAQTISSFGLHADYHQPSDDLSHIDFAHMGESIRSLLEPVRWLANSDFVPAWNAGKQP